MRIFTDSSFHEKEKVAGVGLVVCKGERRDLISNYVRCESNNEGELYAVYLACILSGGEKCEIITDSQVAIQYITKGVADKPRTREQYIRHKRCEYWSYKIRIFKNISFTKVKAHTGYYQKNSIHNTMSDILAKDGLSKYLSR